MRIVFTKTRLWIVGSLFWTGVAAVVVGAFLSPCEIPGEKPQPAAAVGAKQVGDSGGKAGSPTWQQLAAVWGLPLQRALYDPPPKAPPKAPPKPPPPPLVVKLLGPMQESNHLVGMFSVPPDSICIREVGQTLKNEPGEAKIIAIEADHAVLLYNGEQRVLTLEHGH